jgi:ankyrin repeat protein
VKARDNGGDTPLHVAAREGHREAVECIVDRGAYTEVRGQHDGFTPLMRAAFQGHSDVVKCLLDRGEDIGARAFNGFAPLMSAAAYGHRNVALPDRGADVEAKDDVVGFRSILSTFSFLRRFKKKSLCTLYSYL